MQPVKIPITDVLDLHLFNPRDLPDLLADYLAACRAKGLFSVRIIHGKGRHPAVMGFRDAPAESGGWGATLVELRRT